MTVTNTKPDTKKYLHELIEHYEYLLNLDYENALVENHRQLITEEKYKCIHKLRQIKEADLIGMIMANVTAGQSHTMNWI